jgi:hypothetical protein
MARLGVARRGDIVLAGWMTSVERASEMIGQRDGQ